MWVSLYFQQFIRKIFIANGEDNVLLLTNRERKKYLLVFGEQNDTCKQRNLHKPKGRNIQKKLNHKESSGAFNNCQL